MNRTSPLATYRAQRNATSRARRRVWVSATALVLFALLGIPLAVWLAL